VQSLQQEVQEGRDAAHGLRAEGDELRKQLATEQQEHEQAKQALADAQQQLTTTSAELERTQEMVSGCHCPSS
jgi:regulator of replication initiation timing